MAYYTLIGRLTEMESKGSFKKGVAASELKVFLAQENWKDSSRLHHSVREQFLKAAWFSFACFFRR